MDKPKGNRGRLFVSTSIVLDSFAYEQNETILVPSHLEKYNRHCLQIHHENNKHR
jgi:hypothetical protein